mmetsp:Transcript_13526/g.29303  ORF Transcript_13526/g.29303 Transcript_13526/m.29303 type:complete len:135 (+) Transcript_13526:230-634(+)
MGFISLNTNKSENVTFTNRGTKDARVKLAAITSSDDIKYPKTEFTIAPGTERKVPISVSGSRVGQSREVLKVIVNDEEYERSIDVLATVIEHSVALINFTNNKPLNLINFENIFFGEKRKISTYLCNNGPNPVQ